MAKPTFVFVPGACHTPAYLTPTINLLSSSPHSYACTTISLPSVLTGTAEVEAQTATPFQALEADVQETRRVLEGILGKGQDVVLVMHSYGALPGMESLRYFPGGFLEGEKGGFGKGRILRCVYVCAFVLLEGMTLIEAAGGAKDWWDIDSTKNIVRAVNAKNIFYNEVPPTTASHYISTLRPHAYATFFAKLTYSPLMDIPSSYVICENDNCIPVAAQEGTIELARQSFAVEEEKGMGKVVPFDVVERLGSGHMPFLSRVEEIVEVLLRAVGGGLGVSNGS